MARQGEHGIPWTDETWNPTRGCSMVGPDCAHCYAMAVAGRMSQEGGAYKGLVRSTPQGWRWTGVLEVVEELIRAPLRWSKPRVVFVDSMSDLFHERLGDLDIAMIWAVMMAADWHVFQVLTKRSPRMARFLATRSPLIDRMLVKLKSEGFAVPERAYEWPARNVITVVSCGSEAQADRLEPLVDTVSACRGVSLEPLIGPLDIAPWLKRTAVDGRPAVEWVVVGGESGKHNPDVRAMRPSWARDIRDACTSAGVPFVFKQWGEFGPTVLEELAISKGKQAAAQDLEPPPVSLVATRFAPEGQWPLEEVYRGGKHATGRLLDGREHLEMPPLVAQIMSEPRRNRGQMVLL